MTEVLYFHLIIHWVYTTDPFFSSPHSVEVNKFELCCNIIYRSEGGCVACIQCQETSRLLLTTQWHSELVTRRDASWVQLSSTEGWKQQWLTDANARIVIQKTALRWLEAIINVHSVLWPFKMSRAGHAVLWAGLQQNRYRHRISLLSPDRGDLLTPRVYMQDARATPTSPEDTVELMPPHIFKIKTLYLFSLKDIV